MTFTYGLKSARDVFAKLQRDRARLDREITPDRFFNFVVTGYCLVDWVKNDPSVSASVQQAARRMRRDPSIAICRDLANASKHFVLRDDYENPVVAKTSVVTAYGSGRYGKGAYGKGEPTVIIVLIDGQRIGVLEFADRVVKAWSDFLARHSL